ncbi:MAG: FAD-binding oxidoreductase [Flavobacteriaceae bacterium]
MAPAEPAAAAPAAIQTVIEALSERFHNRLSTALPMREQHAHTTTWHPNQPADAVVFAQSTEEVADVVRLCAAHRVPVIPFGTGTSLEGGVNAPSGGICIDLAQMNAVLEVNAQDLDCRVQAGVTRKQLNQHLRDTGLFFPIDPGADASIGGMTATRASGTNAVRYGTMRENVLGLTVVLADGRVIRTGGRARKSSAGYDLTRLFVGSEGTLGIVTEIQLRLSGIPEAIAGGVCPFPSVDAACNAAIATIQCGIPVARMELLDELQVKASNAYSGLSLPESPALFLEFHGSEASVREQSETFGAIAADCGGGDFIWETEAEARTRLWQARHDAYWASLQLRPGARGISTDVCVPISRLADCVGAAREEIERRGFIAPIVGHVGDGNFHILPLVDIDDPKEVEAVEDFLAWLVDLALSMGGTSTGEHGVGQGKVKYLRKEHGGAVDVMAAIKQTLDPDDILNPGKVVPR